MTAGLIRSALLALCVMALFKTNMVDAQTKKVKVTTKGMANDQSNTRMPDTSNSTIPNTSNVTIPNTSNVTIPDTSNATTTTTTTAAETSTTTKEATTVQPDTTLPTTKKPTPPKAHNSVMTVTGSYLPVIVCGVTVLMTLLK